MATSTQALTGNRVYGGVSNSPNRGAVSAAGAKGYIQRELKKNAGIATPVGRDGKSDSRSTVASRALNRAAMHAQGGNKIKPGSGKNKIKPGGGKGSNPIKGKAPVGNAEPTPTPAPKRPVVTITPDGQLQLPYTDTMGQAGLEALNESNAALLDLQQQQQQQAMQYTQANRDLDINQQQDNRDILNSNAAGGTAFSSQYARQRVNSDQQYQNQRGDLELQNTAFNQAAEARRAAILEVFNRMLQSGAYDNVNELAQNAGKLGYGQGAPKVAKANSAKGGNKPGGAKAKAPKNSKGKKRLKPRSGTNKKARQELLKRQVKKAKGGAK